MSEACSRRAALGALASVSALAVAPVAHAAVPRSPELAAAIEAHKAAQAAIDASGDPDDVVSNALMDAESDAFHVVVEAPCASDADFFAKAAYMIGHERKVWDSFLDDSAPFGLLAQATMLHIASRSDT
jgi:hypothetical protein